MPMVSGDGPLETPTGTQAVLNSKEPTLSAREMVDVVEGLTCPRAAAASDRLDGGRGIDMYPDVGVGV